MTDDLQPAEDQEQPEPRFVVDPQDIEDDEVSSELDPEQGEYPT